MDHDPHLPDYGYQGGYQKRYGELALVEPSLGRSRNIRSLLVVALFD